MCEMSNWVRPLRSRTLPGHIVVSTVSMLLDREDSINVPSQKHCEAGKYFVNWHTSTHWCRDVTNDAYVYSPTPKNLHLPNKPRPYAVDSPRSQASP